MKSLLKVRSLKKYFPVYGGLLSRVKGFVKAVDDVSFEIKEGETLGLVGESGCGKSTLAKAIIYLDPPSGGKIYFKGNEINPKNKKMMSEIRKKIQFVFNRR